MELEAYRSCHSSLAAAAGDEKSLLSSFCLPSIFGFGLESNFVDVAAARIEIVLS